MNAMSLNKLLSYLQGLSLTASNQRWQADLGFFLCHRDSMQGSVGIFL